MRHAALTLLAAAHLAGTAVVAARASNKTANAATITIIDGSFPFAADQLLLGAYMAATELNANTSILQDVSLSINRVVMPQAERQPAVVYDMAAGLCNAAQTSAFLSFVTSGTALAVSLICPEIPHFSPASTSNALSDKHIAPLFYRNLLPLSQAMAVFAAPIKFFGWTKVGIVYGETGIWRDAAAGIKTLLRDQGVDVLASVSMADYNPDVSALYYPQIRSSFEFLRSTKLRVFTLMVYDIATMDALMAANKTGLIGPDYVWMTGNAPGYDPDLQSRWDTTVDPKLSQAIITTSYDISPDFDSPYGQAWIPRFVNFANQTLTNQPGLFRDVNFQQTDTTAPDYPANFFYDDPGTNQVPNAYVAGGYDAVNSLAFTFETLITDKSATGTELCNGSLAQFYSIDRLTRPFKEQQTLFNLKQFTPQGDPVASAYTVLQFLGVDIPDQVVDVGSITFDPVAATYKFSMNRITFIWAGNRSLDDVPRDFPPTPEDFVDIKSPSTIMAILISAAVALASLACAAIIAMRQIAPPTVPIVGLGLAVTQTNVLTMIGKDKPVACAFRPWPIVLGLSIVLGAMALKAVFTLINTRWGAMIKSINKTHINLAVAAVVLLFGTLLAVQSATCPLRSEAVFLDWLGGFAYTCVRQGPLSALAILQITGIAFLIVAVAWLSFATRDLPEKLNDSKQTGASVGTIAMFCAVVILQSTTQASVVSQFLFETACVVGVSSFVCWVYLGIPIWRHMQQTADRTHRIHVHRRVRRSAVRTAQLSTESDSVSLDTSFKPFRGEIAEEQQRHAHYMTMRAMIARSVVLQQWRSSVVTLLPAPLFMIRIASEDLTEASTWLPPFLPLSAISLVECGDENDAMGCRVCELAISRRRMRMWFGDSVKAQTWTDAVARLALQRLGRDASEGAGQLLNRVQVRGKR
ncbi:hypothetical protein HK105_203800 [Polyrhizophydium stewartii]|uniref:G-protein coupled receptors family 3 profile domain-containing protein n=1 Tax=Polyrhizophydium stewartii TaxID=2732419 RepID=A0ABR4NB06_9FUNG